MYYSLFVVFLIQHSFISCQVTFPKSPCPEIFKYVYDGTKWIAEITLPTPDVNNVVLSANFSVPEFNVQDIGKLSLNNKNTIDDIRNKRNFIYTYVLAKSGNIPQVTEINYNGNIVCVGPGINNPPFSKFWLSHTYNWYSSDIKPINTPRPHQITTFQPPNDFTEPDRINEYEYENDLHCGTTRNKRNTDSDLVHFIYSGTVVPRNDHPWLAAIYHMNFGSLTFFCGGNLISNKHILSAAHCMSNKKNIQVKVGAHNTNSFFEDGAVIRKVVKIISHREYRQGNGHADISILVMESDVAFTEFVKPICLWNNEDDINSIIGDRGTIMGWGITEKGDTSPTPLQTDTTIVSQQQCQSVKALKDATSNTTFCAGTKGAGPCMGDSGGGLLLRRQGKWYIRGIISISIGNRRLNICDVNTYAVYVDTAKYKNWIIDNME